MVFPYYSDLARVFADRETVHEKYKFSNYPRIVMMSKSAVFVTAELTKSGGHCGDCRNIELVRRLISMRDDGSCRFNNDNEVDGTHPVS
jgi:hypothetical protein